MQVYDLVILLDCGWDERCSKELLSPLKDVSGHLDAVLLTHPDPLHLGALPVLVRPPLCGSGYQITSIHCACALYLDMLWHLGQEVLRSSCRCQAVEPLGCISICIGLQVGQLKCTAPIYATYPVNKMGQMFLYDQCLNRAAVSEFDAYDLNDVDAAFAHITTLKYQQVFSLSGELQPPPTHA